MVPRLHYGVPGEHLGADFQVKVDGERVDYTRVLDTDEGWVTKLCEDPEHGEGPHVDPHDPDEMCEVKLQGHVEVFGPDGEKVDLTERPWPWESERDYVT